MVIAAIGTMCIDEKKGRQGLMLGEDDDENASIEEKLHDADEDNSVEAMPTPEMGLGSEEKFL